jgi:quinohemoprotein amine dehydrogenase
VAADAVSGMRDIAIPGAVLQKAYAVYDRVDYIKVVPETSLARLGGAEHPKGYQQLEAVGYQRGADGKPHTADDVELGPVEVNWSVEEFYAVYGDVWAVATAKTEKDKDGKPLVGKSYLVVAVPMYIQWDQPEVSK